MNFQFPCSTCKRELSAPEAVVGSEVQCPSCRTVFVAKKPHGSGASGIAAERTPYKAVPLSAAANPFRQHTSDDDHPATTARWPNNRSAYWINLCVVLVLTALAMIGIVFRLPSGNSMATMPPSATTKSMATTKPAPPPPWVAPAWTHFRIPNTHAMVSLPGVPSAEPEEKVEAALVNCYTLFDAESLCRFGIATIRLPRTIVDDKQLPTWLRDQLLTKLKVRANQLGEMTGEIEWHGLRGRELRGMEWRLNETKNADSGRLRAFVAHSDNTSTVTVFWITGIDFAVEGEAGKFFDSITEQAEKP